MSASPRSAVLLIGSAKRPNSNSESLGDYLLERLGQTGVRSRKFLVHRVLRSAHGQKEFLEALGSSDLFLLAFPLYVDSLPYLVTKILEQIAAEDDSKAVPGQKFMALVNCGFPEASQCATALAICRRFATETGRDWVGGLALGGGEALGGKPLKQMGVLGRSIRRSLDMAAAALATGESVPDEAAHLMARPLVPPWLYTWIGTRRWKKSAKKHGVAGRLGARPFADR